MKISVLSYRYLLGIDINDRYIIIHDGAKSSENEPDSLPVFVKVLKANK